MRVLTAITMLLCLSANVFAAEVTRYGSVNAVGACQAASPLYDKNLAKRPMAIANRGTTGAFLACSAPNHAYLGSREIQVTFRNTNPTAVEVKCTLVQGDLTSLGGDWYYLPKSLVIQAYDATRMEWNAYLDNAGFNFFRVNFTCLLPPGVEIGEVGNAWDENVGS